ncbi:hypothetical protein JZ751_001086 [Albula glossodonta]|uniref:Uncharacterized protein n=1 Tax=Albula glossodonta TaxID=121402 RepID=A0A8T2PSS6_9TELE|nr:hypothetical protein JZ751_001086 [Albula glossodonta]
MLKKLLLFGLLGAGVFTVGMLLGHFAIQKAESSIPKWVNDVSRDVDRALIERFIAAVDNAQIGENLSLYSSILIYFCLYSIY